MTAMRLTNKPGHFSDVTEDDSHASSALFSWRSSFNVVRDFESYAETHTVLKKKIYLPTLGSTHERNLNCLSTQTFVVYIPTPSALDTQVDRQVEQKSGSSYQLYAATLMLPHLW